MYIYDFYWTEEIIIKLICKHNVLPEEAEQVFSNKRYIKKLNKIMLAYGTNFAGRYLLVVFIETSSSQIKIISARDMTTKERKLYRRKI